MHFSQWMGKRQPTEDELTELGEYILSLPIDKQRILVKLLRCEDGIFISIANSLEDIIKMRAEGIERGFCD